MRNRTKSKTSLFLMELVIAIMFFSVCAALCMQMFVKAHMLGIKTRELNHAVAISQGFAEVMRGTDGSLEAILEYYPMAVSDNDSFFEVYYDKNFAPCDYTDAAYVGDVTVLPNGAIQNIVIRVVRLSDYEEIYTLNATKYMIEPKG